MTTSVLDRNVISCSFSRSTGLLVLMFVVTLVNLLYTLSHTFDHVPTDGGHSPSALRASGAHVSSPSRLPPQPQQQRPPQGMPATSTTDDAGNADADTNAVGMDTDIAGGNSGGGRDGVVAQLRAENAKLRDQLKDVQRDVSNLEIEVAEQRKVAETSTGSCPAAEENTAPWFFRGYSWAETKAFEVLPTTPFNSKMCYKPKAPIWEWFMGPPGFILDKHAFCPAHYFSKLALDGTLTMDGCPPSMQPRWSYRRRAIDKPFTAPFVIDREHVFTSCTFPVQGLQHNLLLMPKLRPELKRERQKKQYNVIHLLLDAVSHRQFRRMFPHTQHFFGEHQAKSSIFKSYHKQRVNYTADVTLPELGAEAFELAGLRVFGGNSCPNKGSMFCGDFQFHHCYPELCNITSNYLFNKFQDAGYVTTAVESYSPSHLNFASTAMDHKLGSKQLFNQYGQWSVNLYVHNKNPGCVDGDFMHRRLFKYMLDFLEIYAGTGVFIGMQMLLAHASNLLQIEPMDVDMRAFFVALKARGFLRNTIVIITSDHGIHATKMNNFISMWLEHKNPMAYMILPKSFLAEHPHAATHLRRNEQRFITHIDMYKTIMRLTEPAYPPLAHVDSFAYDLLADDVPEDRSCRDARVPDKFCACMRRKKTKKKKNK